MVNPRPQEVEKLFSRKLVGFNNRKYDNHICYAAYLGYNNYFESLNCDIHAYYHNLKFDGRFWLYYLLHDLKYKQAYIEEKPNHFVFLNDKDMPRKSFKYLIEG